MVKLRLFASARDAAGVGRAELTGDTVGEIIGAAGERFGDRFAEVAAASTIWVNGEPAEDHQRVETGDEVAVLPPVSGGSV